MAKKFNYEDDLAEIEEFYGEELEDVNIEDIPTNYKVVDDIALDAYVVDGPLSDGDDDPVEYVDHIVFDLTDEAGNVIQYEMLGRIDIEERTYIVLHRMNDEVENSLVALRAWDDENGQLVATEITDEDEAAEVYDMVTKILSEPEDGSDNIFGE